MKKVDAFLKVGQADFEELARKVEIALSYPSKDFQAVQAE